MAKFLYSVVHSFTKEKEVRAFFNMVLAEKKQRQDILWVADKVDSTVAFFRGFAREKYKAYEAQRVKSFANGAEIEKQLFDHPFNLLPKYLILENDLTPGPSGVDLVYRLDQDLNGWKEEGLHRIFLYTSNEEVTSVREKMHFLRATYHRNLVQVVEKPWARSILDIMMQTRGDE